MPNSNTTYSVFLKSALKYTVSLLALAYVTHNIYKTPFSIEQLQSILTLNNLWILCVLTLINWFFECLKWKVVINTFTKLSFRQAAFQTLVAYTYGMITPLNSGNYAKKVFYYPKRHRKRIVFLNVAKGAYQMLVTLIFGGWGLYVLIDEIDFKIANKQILTLVFMAIILIIAFIYRQKIHTLIKSLSLKTHVQLFLYSFAKFICFSLILIVLLQQPHLSSLKLYAGICCVYVISAFLPILNILDFAIKGSVALWLLIPLGYAQQNILIAYFILWICNHALPAITGSLLQFFEIKTKTL